MSSIGFFCVLIESYGCDAECIKFYCSQVFFYTCITNSQCLVSKIIDCNISLKKKWLIHVIINAEVSEPLERPACVSFQAVTDQADAYVNELEIPDTLAKLKETDDNVKHSLEPTDQDETYNDDIFKVISINTSAIY